MNEQANRDTREIAHFDAHAQRWWDMQGEFRTLHDINPVRIEYVDRWAMLKGKRVLDVGCGGGLASEAMARLGAQVTGLDLGEQTLSVAKLHALESGLAIAYRLETVETHAVQYAGNYDVVTCLEMLEHVPDPTSVVAAIARLVRPGGHVFLSTINRNPKAYLFAVLGAEYVFRLLSRGTHTYEQFIKPSELARWSRAAGLEVREIAGIEYNPFSRRAAIGADPSVNYLMHLMRPQDQ